MASEPSLVRLMGSFVVVGDLHGNVDDLIRILERTGYPPNCRYLFLGDYVDRGTNSVEVLLLLFGLKVLFPTEIYLIRGNHECDSICAFYGFRAECEEKFDTDAYFQFVECFSYLPFAATINSGIFCAHGGISPDFSSLEQIAALPRPMLSFESVVSSGLVWSDPRASSIGYEPSDRGSGFLFNARKLGQFLARNGLSLLLRSHEACSEGYERPFGADGRCVTVFSTSDYCGIGNAAAVALVSNDNAVTFETFQPMSQKQWARRRVLIPDWIIDVCIRSKVPMPKFDDGHLFRTMVDDSIDLLSGL
jgi:diadenosine tetraphosphatase ApaH/serine/threonine PP2A family protein phosphatase